MKKAQVLWLIFGVVALLFLIGAATVQPGRPISQYPRVTTLQGTDIFPIARTNVVPATNMGSTWLVMTNDIFTLISNYVNTATNGFTSIPLGYQTNAWTTNVAGTPVIGASSLSISNATTNFNFYGLDSNTVARLWEIGQATNGANAYASNLVVSATNGFLTLVTNIANVASTNNVSVAAGTNTVVETNVVGNHVEYKVNVPVAGVDLAAVTNVVTNFVYSVIGNYMNLSVQAAKLPTTNYPSIDAGWQFWELIYYRTNSVGFTNPLSATWQFVVPTNYFTNNMKVFGQAILLSTNGPTSSNVVWRASIFRATPGDGTDVHQGSFGATVTATQTWAASATGTNKVQSFLIDLSTNSLLQANDFGALKLERVNDIAETNDLKSSVSVIGLQLRY